MISAASKLAALPEADRLSVLHGLSEEELHALPYAWPMWARPEQLPPPGSWRTWLLMGGRGSGKTRPCSEWVRAQMEGGLRRSMVLVGPTAGAIRRDMIEGSSGLLSVAPPWCRPSYESSSLRVVWPNGATAYIVTSEEPDRARGLNCDSAWIDEFAACSNVAEMWSNVQLALRVPGPTGLPPQAVVSTTPKRGHKDLKALIASPSTVVSRARTTDNAANLDPLALEELKQRYGGTQLGRQELDGELLEDAEGALWTRPMLDQCRVGQAPEQLARIVVAIDPSGGSKATNAECGIVVAGVAPGRDGHFYVLADLSGRYTPKQWAEVAIEAYRSFDADTIVAEQNFGGDMVKHTITAVDRNVPVKMVTASRGKAVRAEPIVALYEQKQVHHVGLFEDLETQMVEWVPGEGGPSPDRLDALVWCATELAERRGHRGARRLHMSWMGR